MLKLDKKGLSIEEFFSFVLENNYTKLDCCLENGFDINSYSDDGMTPLMIAVMDKNYAMIDYLMAKGARIDDKHIGKFGIIINAFSLSYTLKPINYQMVEYLLKKGARFDKGDLLLAQNNITLLFMLKKYKGNYVDKIEVKPNDVFERHKKLPSEDLNELFKPSYIQKELEKLA